ncbi:MAG: hypothetical protein ABIZ05_03155 [Pseudonocardiaceae bacterium]
MTETVTLPVLPLDDVVVISDVREVLDLALESVLESASTTAAVAA